jgi:predicted XRE-type DNA-binding protein
MSSSKNVFTALRFSDDDAVIEALRADLADIVRGYIERSQMTQTALERKLGIPQSTVSAIKNDKIDHLSIEYFLRILTRVGIPWTAKCWKPPHDVALVAGGFAQFVAFLQDAPQNAAIVPAAKSDYFLRETEFTVFSGGYTLSGGGTSKTELPLGHDTPAGNLNG